MKTFKKQEGLSMWGWLGVLTMAGLIGIQAFALINPAINYNTAKSVLNAMSVDEKLKGQSVKEIRISLAKKLDFNNVTGLNVKDKEVFVAKKTKSGGYEVTVIFEQKAPLFGPLEMLLTLNHTVEIGNR